MIVMVGICGCPILVDVFLSLFLCFFFSFFFFFWEGGWRRGVSGIRDVVDV